MWRSFFTDRKWLLWSWGGFAFIILSLLAQTYIDVKINEWYKGFYDLLQKAPERELSEFYDGIFLFMKFSNKNYKNLNVKFIISASHYNLYINSQRNYDAFQKS